MDNMSYAEPLISFSTTPRISNNLKHISKSSFNSNHKKTPLPKIVIKKPDDNNENFCDNLNDGELVRDPSDCSSFFTCFLGSCSIYIDAIIEF